LISIDYSLGIQIINFVLLIFILNVLLYKPILGMLDKRKRQIEGSRDEATGLEKSIDEKMSAYEEKLRLAKLEAAELKKELIRQGDEEGRAVIQAARTEIPEIQKTSRLKTDTEIAAAKGVLGDNSRRLSVEIAKKILGRNL
jgi:F-type H+-transporting ATPase subunit b